MELTERQSEIENLDALVAAYLKDIANLLGQLYPEPGGVSSRALAQ